MKYVSGRFLYFAFNILFVSTIFFSFQKSTSFLLVTYQYNDGIYFRIFKCHPLTSAASPQTHIKITISSLLNCVPCMLKMCLRPNVPYVLTCSTCQRALSAYVLICQCAMWDYVLTCQHALRAYVSAYQRVMRAYMLMYQLASFDANIFSSPAIVAEVAHTLGKV